MLISNVLSCLVKHLNVIKVEFLKSMIVRPIEKRLKPGHVELTAKDITIQLEHVESLVRKAILLNGGVIFLSVCLRFIKLPCNIARRPLSFSVRILLLLLFFYVLHSLPQLVFRHGSISFVKFILLLWRKLHRSATFIRVVTAKSGLGGRSGVNFGTALT